MKLWPIVLTAPDYDPCACVTPGETRDEAMKAAWNTCPHCRDAGCVIPRNADAFETVISKDNRKWRIMLIKEVETDV